MESEVTLYSSPDVPLTVVEMSDKSADIQELESFLEGLGVATKGTRLDRYKKYLSLYCSGELESSKEIFKNVEDDRFKSELDWYLYVLREIDELLFIYQGVKNNPPRGLSGKLQKIVSGADFAALDRNTESRNTQYELRVASYFCRAGFDVDVDGLTDVIASKNNICIYVECKRISSTRRLEENLKYAKKQLVARLPKNSGAVKYYGLIAADVTKVAYSHNGLTVGITNEHAKKDMQESLKKIRNGISEDYFFSAKPPIVMCWLQIHMPGILLVPSQPFTRFSSYFIVNDVVSYKCRDALSLIESAIVLADFSDEKAVPLGVLRNSVTIPEGSELWFDEDVFNEVFVTGNSEEIFGWDREVVDGERIVGGLRVKGVGCNFTYAELGVLVLTTHKDDFLGFEEATLESKTKLLCMLYARKFPYEGDGPAL